MKIQISDIRIRKIMNKDKLCAVVSLTINESIAIHDIKLVQGEERMFVAMPSKRDKKGTYHDIVHPLNAEVREYLEQEILNAYDDYVSAG